MVSGLITHADKVLFAERGETKGDLAAHYERVAGPLLRTMGANNSAGTQLLSYLLFERGYTRELIALGLSDARARADEIATFLSLKRVKPSAANRAV